MAAAMPASPPAWAALDALAAEKGWTSARRLADPFRARERRFGSDTKPAMVLWRDNYGWCPFCGATQLLLEEKQIPYVAVKVPLNNYKAKEKPRTFLDRVPNGLLP